MAHSIMELRLKPESSLQNDYPTENISAQPSMDLQVTQNMKSRQKSVLFT